MVVSVWEDYRRLLRKNVFDFGLEKSLELDGSTAGAEVQSAGHAHLWPEM